QAHEAALMGKREQTLVLDERLPVQMDNKTRVDAGWRCLILWEDHGFVHQLLRTPPQPHREAMLAEPTLGTTRRVLTITGGVDGVPPGTIEALHSSVHTVVFKGIVSGSPIGGLHFAQPAR